jgi:hypothetical protein
LRLRTLAAKRVRICSKSASGRRPNATLAASPRRAGRRSGPGQMNPVGFGEHNPRLFVIEAETAFCGGRYFNCIPAAPRRGVGDGKQRYYFFAVLIGDGKDDGAGAVLYAFFLTLEMLLAPQIAVPDNEAGNRFGKRHAMLASARGRKPLRHRARGRLRARPDRYP